MRYQAFLNDTKIIMQSSVQLIPLADDAAHYVLRRRDVAYNRPKIWRKHENEREWKNIIARCGYYEKQVLFVKSSQNIGSSQTHEKKTAKEDGDRQRSAKELHVLRRKKKEKIDDLAAS
jgi:hypothetical protein